MEVNCLDVWPVKGVLYSLPLNPRLGRFSEGDFRASGRPTASNGSDPHPPPRSPRGLNLKFVLETHNILNIRIHIEKNLFGHVWYLILVWGHEIWIEHLFLIILTPRSSTFVFYFMSNFLWTVIFGICRWFVINCASELWKLGKSRNDSP